MEREGSPLADRDEKGRWVHLDIIPDTFMLPHDHGMFVEEFRCVWVKQVQGWVAYLPGVLGGVAAEHGS